MENYIEPIKYAIILFPFIAFLFTLPYILHQYHKYGSVYYLRVLIIYSFILYLISAYFLVILPLPSFEEVSQMTSPTTQLVPFSFVRDFIEHSSFQIQDFSTYVKALMEPYCYVVLYNILLTIPFGIYLGYYFKYSLKKCVFYAFCLSLFFELTQLSGLYGIYPRGYRLFDVDDLILNTLGGLIGYLCSIGIRKILPSREKIDQKAYELGKKVSWLKRTTLFFLDLFFFTIFASFVQGFVSGNLSLYLTFLFYYVLCPYWRKGKTLAGSFLNVKIEVESDRSVLLALFFRQHLFYIGYFVLPFYILALGGGIMVSLPLPRSICAVASLLVILSVFGYLFGSFLRLIRKKKPYYECLSKTKLVSTIGTSDHNEKYT